MEEWTSSDSPALLLWDDTLGPLTLEGERPEAPLVATTSFTRAPYRPIAASEGKIRNFTVSMPSIGATPSAQQLLLLDRADITHDILINGASRLFDMTLSSTPDELQAAISPHNFNPGALIYSLKIMVEKLFQEASQDGRSVALIINDRDQHALEPVLEGLPISWTREITQGQLRFRFKPTPFTNPMSAHDKALARLLLDMSTPHLDQAFNSRDSWELKASDSKTRTHVWRYSHLFPLYSEIAAEGARRIAIIGAGMDEKNGQIYEPFEVAAHFANAETIDVFDANHVILEALQRPAHITFPFAPQSFEDYRRLFGVDSSEVDRSGPSPVMPVPARFTEKIRPHFTDFLTMPFPKPDKPYDLINCLNVFQHMTPRSNERTLTKGFVLQMLDSLSIGGRLLITFNKDPLFTKEELDILGIKMTPHQTLHGTEDVILSLQRVAESSVLEDVATHYRNYIALDKVTQRQTPTPAQRQARRSAGAWHYHGYPALRAMQTQGRIGIRA